MLFSFATRVRDAPRARLSTLRRRVGEHERDVLSFLSDRWMTGPMAMRSGGIIESGSCIGCGTNIDASGLRFASALETLSAAVRRGCSSVRIFLPVLPSPELRSAYRSRDEKFFLV